MDQYIFGKRIEPIPVEKIERNGLNPRKTTDEEADDRLL